MTKAEASIRIPFRSERQMRAIVAAIRPEIVHPAGTKANAAIVARGNRMILKFEAKDSTTLRAILSSHLRLIRASVNTFSAVLQLERKTSGMDKA